MRAQETEAVGAEPPAAAAGERSVTRNTSILFHVSLLYNLVLRHEQRRPWWSHIEPLLLLGALPLREEQHLVQLTKDKGVRAIVTMNQPYELLPNLLVTPITPQDWLDAGVVQCFGATNDFSPPTIETIHRCVEFIHTQVDLLEKTTYVHCKAGRGRSTVVVVAFLVQHRALSLEDAIAFTRAKRPHVSLSPKQRTVLTAFCQTYGRH